MTGAVKWFAGCQDVGEVKGLYRKLAKTHHPDLSKSEDATRIMQEINAEYHAILEGMHGQVRVGSDGQEHTYYYNQEIEQELMDKINEVLALRMPNVEVELVGTWLWVYGDTKPFKDTLGKDGLGMRWHSKRKKWYFRRKSYRRQYSEKDFSELRTMYGSQRFHSEESKGLPSGR